MDQVGYKGVDEHTFVDANNGKSPPPAGGHVGIFTDSLPPVTTEGFGAVESDGFAPGGTRS